MTNTATLIAHLSREATTPTPVRAPGYWVARVIAVLILYGVGAALFLGLRPDLAEQMTRPAFLAEITLLALLVLTSALAAVIAMAPDAYQKLLLLKLPYAVLVVFAGLIVSQLFMPLEKPMAVPPPGTHGMGCAICIASVALIPSALIFALLRKGASVRPLQAGSFAVLAASSLGCLSLRVAEANDSMAHLISWHYLPTLLFAALGALLGKWLLKW